MAFFRRASSRFIADYNSVIFLLFVKSSAVFFSDSSLALVAFVLYSSMRVWVRLPPVLFSYTIFEGI